MMDIVEDYLEEIRGWSSCRIDGAVGVCVRVCVKERERARERGYACVCSCVYACVYACVHACVYACGPSMALSVYGMWANKQTHTPAHKNNELASTQYPPPQ